jgi:hypothetical protein
METRPSLDWALIEITAKDLPVSNIIQTGETFHNPRLEFAKAKGDVSVVARMGDLKGSKRELTGFMSGTSTFLKMRDRDRLEEARTVQFESNLRKSFIPAEAVIR